MKHMLIRYGMFGILALMFSGIGWMATHYTLRVKLPVTLCRTEQGYCAWLPLTVSDSYHTGDSLRVLQTSAGNLAFRIDSVWQERSYRVCYLQDSLALRSCSKADDSLLTGYVTAGSESLGTLIMRKLQFR